MLKTGIPMAENHPQKFPPLTYDNWRSLPVFSGRIATNDDVNSRKAVFSTSPDLHREIYNIELPFFAICTNSGNGEKIPIVAIQAELCQKAVLIGAVKLDGERYVCTLSELKII